MANEQSMENSTLRPAPLLSRTSSMMTNAENECKSPSLRPAEGLISNELMKYESRKIPETLPSGWIKQYSKSKERDYWFNTFTGFSSWIHPSFI